MILPNMQGDWWYRRLSSYDIVWSDESNVGRLLRAEGWGPPGARMHPHLLAAGSARCVWPEGTLLHDSPPETPSPS